MRVFAGIDIGGTNTKGGIFSEDGTLLFRWEFPTDKKSGEKAVLREIAAWIKEAADNAPRTSLRRNRLAGIGVAVPGPVIDESVVDGLVNIGWGRVNVKEELGALTYLDNIRVINDANAAALGEMWKGSGAGHSNIVAVTLGTGVGGGLIIDGEIVKGAFGAAGEIGHMTVNAAETKKCNCGKKGCLEQYASATGIVNAAKELIAARELTQTPDTDTVLTRTPDTDTALTRMPETEPVPAGASETGTVLSGAFTAKDVFEAAKKKDPVAAEATERAFRYLGMALANVAAAVDPELFIIGGGVSNAGDILLDGIRKYYREYAFRASIDTEIVRASLGGDAGMYGAAKLALMSEVP